jgi:hypothetical protein
MLLFLGIVCLFSVPLFSLAVRVLLCIELVTDDENTPTDRLEIRFKYRVSLIAVYIIYGPLFRFDERLSSDCMMFQYLRSFCNSATRNMYEITVVCTEECGR